MATVDVTDELVMIGLRSFLLSVLDNTDVILGQVNRVPSPTNPNFVVMTPLIRKRLSTNIVWYFDPGTNNVIQVDDNTPIGALANEYHVFIRPTDIPGGFPDGFRFALQPTEYTVQLDLHGPLSTDAAQVVTTLFRDDYAYDYFATNSAGIYPLFTGDARQMPFVNGEHQYEDRWTVDVVLQINPVVATPQQFADAVSVVVVNPDQGLTGPTGIIQVP